MDKHASITTDTNGPIGRGEHRGATTVGSGAIARSFRRPAVMPVPTYSRDARDGDGWLRRKHQQP